MFELIITIVFLVFTALREYFFYVERQKLLDRIQARDLSEYKAFVEEPKKEEKETKVKEHNWL